MLMWLTGREREHWKDLLLAFESVMRMSDAVLFVKRKTETNWGPLLNPALLVSQASL